MSWLRDTNCLFAFTLPVVIPFAELEPNSKFEEVLTHHQLRFRLMPSTLLCKSQIKISCTVGSESYMVILVMRLCEFASFIIVYVLHVIPVLHMYMYYTCTHMHAIHTWKLLRWYNRESVKQWVSCTMSSLVCCYLLLNWSAGYILSIIARAPQNSS